MSRTGRFVAATLTAVLCAAFAFAVSSDQTPAKPQSPSKVTHKHSKAKAKPKVQAQQPAPDPVPPPPPGPLTPFTLDQTPATPPHVAFKDGLLSITAQNSTLADILRAVHTQTGAAIDVPSGASDRVVGNFGPGPSREVMAMLLNGSRFNYVMVGSAADSSALEKIVLSPKPPANGTVAQAVQPNAPPNPFARGREVNMSEDEQSDDDNNDSQPIQPEISDQSQDNNGQSGIKTPEQILQELQRQQIQQQQQQQQQQGQPGQPAQDPSTIRQR